MQNEFGPIRSYIDLTRALSERRQALGMSLEDLDARAGLADRHASKLMCGTRHFGHLSFGLVLEALGAELVLRARSPKEHRYEDDCASAA